jgi:hypothetical protein
MRIVQNDLGTQHRQTLSAGQVTEFKVWSELVRQSAGGLHIFLPLRDMGLDAVMHRLGDGAYIALQVKGRTELTPAGQVHITVTANSLVDDEALIVAALVEGERLGPMVLVVEERTFRQLASHDVVEGREYLTAAFEMHEGGRSRWAPFLVPRERLAERFGIAMSVEAQTPLVEGAVDRGHVGFMGETEVVRQLARSSSLNLFRPFPDLETVEVLARHAESRRFLGLQVKTCGWDAEHLENRVHLRRSSFRPSPSTYLCVLGWNRAGSFDDSCLLIPSLDVADIARVEGEWLVLELEPGAEHHRRLDEYRMGLSTLGATVEGLLRPPP